MGAAEAERRILKRSLLIPPHPILNLSLKEWPKYLTGHLSR
jgi:hypothetical protein